MVVAMLIDRQLQLMRQTVDDFLEDGLIDEDVHAILMGRIALIAAAVSKALPEDPRVLPF